MKRFIFFALVALVSVSCAKQFDHLLKENEVVSISSSNPYKISEQEALNELNLFLKSLSGDTKSTSNNLLSQKKVGKLQSVRTSANTKQTLTKAFLKTKSSDTTNFTIPDTLMYIVNFEDDGFAVLAADSRITSTILAVVESGTMSLSDFNVNEYLTSNYSSDSLQFNYFQFIDDEDEDEEDFDEDEDYTNFDENDDDNEDENVHHFLDGEELTPTQIVGGLIYDYTIDEIINNPNPLPGQGNGNDHNNCETIGDTNDTTNIGGWSSNNYYWLTTQEVPTMLTTLWGQSNALQINRYAPIKQNGEHAPLGCGAVAVAQVLAYHAYPKHFTINGNYFDWDKMKTVSTIYDRKLSPNDENTDLLAKFIYLIGRICKTHYRIEGSWTLTKHLKRALYAAVYRGVHKKNGYHGNTIISMLDNNNPVLISATKKWKISDPLNYDGHIWVIDGYKIQKKVETNFGQYVGERILLHCNWGWWGSCNGYYEAKIFDLKKGAIEYDNYIIKENNHDKYENLKLSRRFRMIEYQNPNE